MKMTTLEITVNENFGGLSRSMQRALAFLLTRHMVGQIPGYGEENGVRVAHPDRPCMDYEDMTARVFSSSRILDAMVKRDLVEIHLEKGGAFARLTPAAFDIGTQLMGAIEHALLHGHVRTEAA